MVSGYDDRSNFQNLICVESETNSNIQNNFDDPIPINYIEEREKSFAEAQTLMYTVQTQFMKVIKISNVNFVVNHFMKHMFWRDTSTDLMKAAKKEVIYVPFVTQRIREDIKLRLELAYSSFACKSSWILITSLDLLRKKKIKFFFQKSIYYYFFW